MEKVKNKYSFIIKTICYIAIPVLVINLILSIVSIVFFVGENIDSNIKNYFETELFASAYRESIVDNTYNSVYYYEPRQYYFYDVLESDVGYNVSKIYYNMELQDKNFKYLVIDRNKNIAFTNLEKTMKADNIEKIINEISKNKYYWNYSNREIETNIEKLTLENIKYLNDYERIEEDYNCEIYTSISDELENIDKYYREELVYSIARTSYKTAYINIPIAIVLIICCIIIVTVLAGRKKGEEAICLTSFDKIPLEIMGVIAIIIVAIPLILALKLLFNDENIILGVIFIFVTYIGTIICYDTLIKRLKTHTIFKNMIIYKLAKLGIKALKDILKNINIGIRILALLGIFIILNYILAKLEFIGIVLLIAMWVFTYIIIYRRERAIAEIKSVAKKIYEGNPNIKLDEKLYSGVLKELCIYINDIAGGFSNAIEQGIKSERMKTELITNVSHDIKTPLTSIINYVDLLKKEEIKNEKAIEYLEILDQKSQRLKRLTEDLVEASKASSGNIKLNMEKIDVKELINQISGEFEDRFKDKELEAIIDMPEENVYINADSRYLYRVIENMYSNIVKYALEGSRVYIDVVLKNNNVEIRLKNISKDKLNISAEELMQRFVRGEASRNTEGSGLGLSIAESLTKLQNGEFNIYLDGDLFKVIILFQRM